MFNTIKDHLKKIYSQFTSKISNIFNKVDKESLKQLEELLISSDMGLNITRHIMVKANETHGGNELKSILEEELCNLLATVNVEDYKIFLMVGINGSGKTTFIAKLANKFKNDGKRVLLVAADTFRAAGITQLEQWGKSIGVEVLSDNSQDPASIVFSACKRDFDKIIIDTAGRLQTKVNLMKELEKIKKVINKQLPHEKICTLITIDAMLGQNSLEQAKIFNESTALTGIVLTKMDGTGKGGIIFAICQELKIPIAYISFGEKLDNFERFDIKKYVSNLLG